MAELFHSLSLFVAVCFVEEELKGSGEKRVYV